MEPDMSQGASVAAASLLIQIGIEFGPLVDRRHNAHGNHFVTKGAEVFVALFKLTLFFRCAFHGLYGNSILGNHGLHGHHDMAEAVVVHIYACRPAERLAAHCGCNHLDGEICRALERRTSAEIDNVLSALDYAHLEVGPFGFGELLGSDDFGKGLAVNLGGRCEYCHLLAVAAICTAVDNLVGRFMKLF